MVQYKTYSGSLIYFHPFDLCVNCCHMWQCKWRKRGPAQLLKQYCPHVWHLVAVFIRRLLLTTYHGHDLLITPLLDAWVVGHVD